MITALTRIFPPNTYAWKMFIPTEKVKTQLTRHGQYNPLMLQILFLIWVTLLTACGQTQLVEATSTPAPTPTPADPAELSQADLTARIVENITGHSSGDIDALIEIYQASFTQLDPDASAGLAELGGQLAAGGTVSGEDAMLWLTQVLSGIDARETQYMNVPPQPGKVASNRVEAFIQAHDFVDAFAAADEDSRFSHPELANLAQLSANAEASLANTGDPPLIEFSRQIDQVMRHAARSEWPQAREAMEQLRRNLPRRPQP